MNFQNPASVDRRRIFATGSWFAQLPPALKDEVLRSGRERMLAAGQMLFAQGDAPSGLHGVLSGEIHIIGQAGNGQELLMAIHRPGDWTGFLACADGEPHPLSAQAVTDVGIFTVPPAAVSAIFESDVASFRHLVAPELRIGRANYRWLVEMLTRPSPQRVAERLLQLARWPYGPQTGPTSPIENVSQEALAGACNLSRQTMNSVLRQLEARGMIRIGYGRIEIIDCVGLQKFALSDPDEIEGK
jgi:CRP-like cAMP-binding protein